MRVKLIFKFRKCSTSLGVKELKELSLRLGVKPLAVSGRFPPA